MPPAASLLPYAGAAAASYVGGKLATRKQSPLVTTTTPDPVTEDYRKQILSATQKGVGAGQPSDDDFRAWIAGQEAKGIRYGDTAARYKGKQQFLQEWNAAHPQDTTALGPSPEVAQLLELLGGYTNLGGKSTAILGGDAGAIKDAMNPYESSVLASLDPFYEDASKMALKTLGDQFTSQKAFGGSRQGVAEGVALSKIAQDKARTAADYRYKGYNDVMERALSGSQMGLAGGGVLASLKDWLETQRNPDLKKASLLKGGLAGLPYGSSTSQPVDSGSQAGNMIGLFAALLGSGLFGKKPS